MPLNLNNTANKEGLALMLELGFSASYSPVAKPLAKTIIEAYRVARPDSINSTLCEAMLYCSAEKNPEKAVKLMRDLDLDFAQEDAQTLAFFAFFLMTANYKSEAQKVIDYVLSSSKDEFAEEIQKQLNSNF